MPNARGVRPHSTEAGYTSLSAGVLCVVGIRADCLDGTFDFTLIAQALFPIIDREKRKAVEEALDKVILSEIEGVKWSVLLIPEEKQRVLNTMFPSRQ